MKTVRRIGRIILIPVIVILSLLLVAMILIQIPAVQTRAAKYAVEQLNEEFGTEIDIESVRIGFRGNVILNGVTSKDDRGFEFINIKKLSAGLDLIKTLRDPNNIFVKKLELIDPDVRVITYKGDSISNFISMIEKFDGEPNDEPSKFKLRGNVIVKNGNLLIQNQNLEGYKQNWVEATRFNLDAENFKLEGDKIWADFKTFNFKGKRNGEDYNLKNFIGQAHYSNQEISFANWNFETDDSHITGRIKLFYESSEDLSDFLNRVNWDMELEDGSYVNFKDIRYFVDEFDKDNRVNVRGVVSGTLNNMTFDELQMDGEGVFLVADRLNLIDMTEGEQIIIDSKSIKAKTSYDELNQLLPTFITQNIPDFGRRFGTVDYSGDFNLDPSQIRFTGYTVTALGDADVQITLDDYKENLKYKGRLITDNLNLNQITEVEELGFVKGVIDFDGRGTDIKNLVINADGNFDYMDLMGKRYQNVKVDGDLNDQRFKGVLSVADPNLNAEYNGLFDFSGESYKMDFVFDANHLDLDYLEVTKDLNARFSGKVTGDFIFSDLDDLLGKVQMENVHFVSKKDTLDLKSAYLNSTRDNGIQTLTLDVPDYLSGEISGKYKLSQLPDAFMNAVGSSILMTYEPEEVDPNQDFHFFFDVEQDLFSLFDPRIKIAPGSIIDGIINTETGYSVAELSSTELGFDGFNMFGALLNVDTSRELGQIYIHSDSLSAKDVVFYDVDMYSTPREDSLMIKTQFHMGKDYRVDFDLNLYQTIDEVKNLVFGFSPSTIDIDGMNWHLNPLNDRNTNRAIINFDTDYYELQNLLLESGDQKLSLNGYYRNNKDYVLGADLRNLILSKIIPEGLLGDVKIDGIANGDVDIKRTEDTLKPLMGVKVEGLSINDYELGELNLNGVYNIDEKVFDLELFLERENVQVLYANGFIDNAPEIPQINMAVSLDDLNFGFLESFLSAAMSNVRGLVSGDVRFSGPVDSPDFEGMLDLADLGFKIDYLNVDYSFDGVYTVPVFKQSGGQGFISLDEVRFRDTRYNTWGETTGEILFHDFSTWFLNLSFNTKNLLVLNTKPRHNDLFYGTVFGQGAFEIFGPPNKLDISASATVNDGSVFTINTGATKVESKNDLVRFIPEVKDESVADRGPQGMNIDLEITATSGSVINLIFDPMSGDMVTATGNTNKLLFSLDRSGLMSMNGTYTLDEGQYKLRQVPLFHRDFTIKPGSNVRWDGGSPFDAVMDITASFERAVSNVGEFLGTGYSQTYDVVLEISITESLAKPDMDFGIKIPKGGTDVQTQIDYKFNLDPDEKLIQFGSVLLLNQFMTSTDSDLFPSGGVTAGAGIALKQLGGVLNELISETGFSVIFDYIGGSELSNTSDQFKTGLKGTLSPRWTINGQVGVPVGSTYANETTTMETEIDWDISRNMDKALVINFFTRPTNFGIRNFGGTGNFQSFGAGITYRTSFNRISEIFEKEEKPATVIIQEEETTSQIPSIINFSKPLKEDESDGVIEVKEKDSHEPVLEKEKVTALETKPKTKKSEENSNSTPLVRFK